jgi:hypothetical protein
MQTVKTLWLFFQNQILGMKWLQDLIIRAAGAMGLDTNGRLGGSIVFFVYDTIKIFVLLSVLIFVISYIPKPFSAAANKKNPWTFSWGYRERPRGAAGYGDAVLLLLVHSAVHRIFRRGAAGGRDVFVSHFLAAR